MELESGIEPASAVYETAALPLSYTSGMQNAPGGALRLNQSIGGVTQQSLTLTVSTVPWRA